MLHYTMTMKRGLSTASAIKVRKGKGGISWKTKPQTPAKLKQKQGWCRHKKEITDGY